MSKFAVLLTLVFCLVSVELAGKTPVPNPLPGQTRADLASLSLNLGILENHLQMVSARKLGIGHQHAARLFEKLHAENISYARTTAAAIEIVRKSPTLENMFNAGTAFTGFEYDMESLLTAAELSGSQAAVEWAVQTRKYLDHTSQVGNACSDGFAAYMAKRDAAP